AAGGEVAFRQGPEIDHGIAMAQLPEDQPNQSRTEENRQRLHAPERIAQPVPFLALAQQDLPANDDDHQERQPDRIEAEWPLAKLQALGDEVVRIVKLEIASGEGE